MYEWPTSLKETQNQQAVILIIIAVTQCEIIKYYLQITVHSLCLCSVSLSSSFCNNNMLYKISTINLPDIN